MWAASLREVKTRIRPLFTQERVATNAGLFLEALLGDEQRKTGWMRAEAAGDPGPWRQQAILGRRDWDADALRDIVRSQQDAPKPCHVVAVVRCVCEIPIERNRIDPLVRNLIDAYLDPRL